MLVRGFFEKFAHKDPQERSETVRALAHVYLNAPLDPEERRAAVIALTAVLDDPAPRVRRALAEALADDALAPRNVILSLTEDQPDIAAIVLEHSPVLSDADLVDIAGAGGERHRVAIARRPFVGVGLSAALAEVSGAETCLVLVANEGANIAASTFRRMIDRHRSDAALRSALLERNDLPLGMRQSLIEGLSEALGDLVRLHDWLAPEQAERMFREAQERVLINLTLDSEPAGLRCFVERLAAERKLTPTLLIRAACVGNLALFRTAFSVLANMPEHRVVSLLQDRGGAGFIALYRRTDLPSAAFCAFAAIVKTIAAGESLAGGRLMIDRVEQHYRDLSRGEDDEYFALLGRLGAEAAREHARAESGNYGQAA